MTPVVSFVPNISVCQSSDCTKLTINIDTVGMPNPFKIDDILIDVKVNGIQTVSALSIYDDLFSTLTGTGTIGFATNHIIGAGTLFNSEVENGDYIYFENYPSPLIIYQHSLSSPNTSLHTTTYNWSSGISGADMIVFKSVIELPYTTLGGVSSLENGDYEIIFTYQLNSGYNDDIIGSFKFSVCCTDYCGVYQKLADIANSCDDCLSSENIINALLAWALLQSANGSAACGNTINSDEILQKLQNYLDNQPCNCK